MSKKATRRKRLEWLGLMWLGPIGGQIHADRWHSRSLYSISGPWGKHPSDDANYRRIKSRGES